MVINTRTDALVLTLTEKVTKGCTTYEPLAMTDFSVFNLAQHYYTATEIAARFKVSETTLMKHHGEAFNAGRDDVMQKPRMLLNKIFKDFEDAAINFANPDAPMTTLLAAMKLHAQKYEGLGSKTEVHHTGVESYDKVQTKPKIVERPE